MPSLPRVVFTHCNVPQATLSSLDKKRARRRCGLSVRTVLAAAAGASTLAFVEFQSNHAVFCDAFALPPLLSGLTLSPAKSLGVAGVPLIAGRVTGSKPRFGKQICRCDSGERVIDLEALLASQEDGDPQEDADGRVEPWEHMVDRIQFEGGTPTASDFRAPTPTPSPYSATSGFREIDFPSLEAVLAEPGAELWDVREEEEFAMGHLPRSRNVPFHALQQAASARAAQAEAAASAGTSLGQLCLVCASGARSSQAQVRLTQVHGLEEVVTIRGGIALWEAMGKNLET